MCVPSHTYHTYTDPIQNIFYNSRERKKIKKKTPYAQCVQQTGEKTKRQIDIHMKRSTGLIELYDFSPSHLATPSRSGVFDRHLADVYL